MERLQQSNRGRDFTLKLIYLGFFAINEELEVSDLLREYQSATTRKRL
jgi:hypothetical protein